MAEETTGTENTEQTDDAQNETFGILDDESQIDPEANTTDADGNDSEQRESATLTAEAIAQIVESAIDRRLSTPKQRQRGQSSQGQRQAEPGVDVADIREARANYRDYIADEIKFLGTPERDFALSLAEEQIRSKLDAGEDPVRVGRTVARDVAKNIQGMRSMYEKKVISGLRSKGMLVEKSQSTIPGQPYRQERTPAGNDGSSWAKGQNRAARMGRAKS